MIDRTECVLQDDGTILLERYGIAWSRSEAQRLRDNLDRCLSGLGRMIHQREAQVEWEEQAQAPLPNIPSTRPVVETPIVEKVAGQHVSGLGV